MLESANSNLLKTNETTASFDFFSSFVNLTLLTTASSFLGSGVGVGVGVGDGVGVFPKSTFSVW
ncbi:hypothetical protein [Ureaplasma urealyticum]|uniref:hypothetical protein n=1 Tax=Ureaplasma urealyticum TaxID=2130 RepID=UPI000169CD1A|nr:hypothetical protein [Ureaplasma urealyticum]